MLNPALRNKIVYPEYRLLYDSMMRISSTTIRNEIGEYIKKLRNEHTDKTIDKLTAKAKQFPKAGDWAKAKMVEFCKVAFDTKTAPVEHMGQWRSIEFELIFKSRDAQDEFVNACRIANMIKLITIKDDGSVIRNADDKTGVPREVVLTYRVGNEKMVYDFCRLLRGKAYVNNSCGTHVHFDMRHVGEDDVVRYGKRLARCVPALRMLLPKIRRKNEYCRNTISSIHDGDRYSFVNLRSYQKHKTIEVRAHSGTINAEKIVNWIALCERIMSVDPAFLSTYVKGDVNTIQDLLNQYEFPKDLTDYVKSRNDELNSPKSKETEGEEKVEEPAWAIATAPAREVPVAPLTP